MIENQEFFDGKMIELSTELEKPSPFFLGYNIEENFLKEIEKLSFDKLFFLSEKKLFDIHGKNLFERIKKKYSSTTLNFLPASEGSKTFKVLSETCESLIQQNVSKKSILISFGGGGVGNLVGLAAGLIFRGIRFIEVATTFTGQTDSTLSNKQAINGNSGKNHFGLYHAPVFIWADTRYLKTEPAFSIRSGIIEGIKNGFISNPNFLTYLNEILRPKLDFSEAEKFNLVLNIILSKLNIIRLDPTERKYGIILEYGHTFGHAIEWLKKGELSHGEAVSFGMKLAAELGKKIGFLSQGDVDLHYELIENKLGFNNPFPKDIGVKELMNAMLMDNKKTGTSLRFVILKKIGECDNSEGDYLFSVDLNFVENEVVRPFIERQNST